MGQNLDCLALRPFQTKGHYNKIQNGIEVLDAVTMYILEGVEEAEYWDEIFKQQKFKKDQVDPIIVQEVVISRKKQKSSHVKFSDSDEDDDVDKVTNQGLDEVVVVESKVTQTKEIILQPVKKVRHRSRKNR